MMFPLQLPSLLLLHLLLHWVHWLLLITLLLIGAALFYQSLAIRSDMMRKAGLALL